MSKKLLLMFLFVGAVAFTITACGDKKTTYQNGSGPTQLQLRLRNLMKMSLSPVLCWIAAATTIL